LCDSLVLCYPTILTHWATKEIILETAEQWTRRLKSSSLNF